MVTELKNEITNKYIGGIGVWSLSKNYGVTRTTIKNILKEEGIRLRGYDEYNFRVYQLDETCLDQIDSELKAYFLGFFFADGCNYHTDCSPNNKYRIAIQLQASDENILESFNKDLFKTNKPLYMLDRNSKNNKHQDGVVLQIQSKTLSNRLYELGAVSNKTFSLKFPILPDNLVHHFIRGFFDGDGFISDYVVKDTGRTRQRISIIGITNFMESLQDILVLNGFNKNKLMKAKQDYLSILEYGGNQVVMKFANYIYKDATIYLERKKQRFNKIFNLHEK